MPNDFLFVDDDRNTSLDPSNALPFNAPTSWKVLIVDDEPEVHTVTKLAMSDFEYLARSLEFMSAYSAHEAKAILKETPDIALVLLDVVMETEDAGLRVAEFIRETLDNHITRIILRTGQPGQAPERKVIVDYDINDYKHKTELTAQKLFTVMMASIRSYSEMDILNKSRLVQKEVLIGSTNMFEKTTAEEFVDGLQEHLNAVIGCFAPSSVASSFIVKCNNNDEVFGDIKIIASGGSFSDKKGKSLSQCFSDELVDTLEQSYRQKKLVYDAEYLCSFCVSDYSSESLLYYAIIPLCLTPCQQCLIEIFTKKVQIAYENMQMKQELAKYL
ncbi:DUF3369 domain-containing protein [Flocculibacter collagenilyticus]|uniref:DUF3369 domain-containing protein n=1 Tax=Flocculibacter collagenilyticus TaxID=2744479 RepID=UPI0018F69FDA|nr:DUF3369 domain-containing protein [Flocculibacter collagenilyticus]